MKSVILITQLLILIPLHSVAQTSIQAVYGNDDRKEIYEVDNAAARRAMQATVMIAEKANVIEFGGEYRLTGDKYGKSMNLCPSEPFWHQPLIGFCTGVLVRPNVILTAGHCIVKQRDCSNSRVVFDVKFTGPGEFSEYAPARNVRACKRIIKRENKKNGLDYAFIELDSPVHDRQPITLSQKHDINSKVFMIGHPRGLPAKYSGPAKIYGQTDLEWITDLDSFAGNSGSPVFEAATGALVGILTLGEDDDFQEHTKSQCSVSKKCTAKTCYGEYVVKSQVIRQNSGL